MKNDFKITQEDKYVFIGKDILKKNSAKKSPFEFQKGFFCVL